MPDPVRIRLGSLGMAALAALSMLLAACVTEVVAPAYEPPAAEVQVAPPPLPVYVQPPCPVDGWMWTPGYWAWAPAGYYWVPGTWVAPPQMGVLWTPGYWGFIGGAYVWHAGYWGPHVGFYGGVHYGFGYNGVGYGGGHWDGDRFAYNRSVTNVNVTVIHNTYYQTVINNNVNVTRVSYNGGAGGIRAMPTPQERIAEQEQHTQATPVQQQHVQQARNNPALMVHANNGHPEIAATPRPGAFNAPGVARSRGAENEPPRARPAMRPAMRPGNAAQPARNPRPPAAKHQEPRKPAKDKRPPGRRP